jgi:hypothetical protein
MQAANGTRWTAAEKATVIKEFDVGAADDRGYQEAKLDAYNALQSKQKSLQADENKLVGQLAKQSTHLVLSSDLVLTSTKAKSFS